MSLLKKLRFKPSAPIYLLGDAVDVCIVAPEEGFSFLIKRPAKADGPLDQFLLFVRDSASLQKEFSALLPQLAEGAIIWIAYPKKGCTIPTDLNRDNGWGVVAKAGYVAVSQAAINEDWSALWFKKTDALKKHLRATPMHERQTEGIDYVARTVSLPADAAEALLAVPGLPELFDGFSFTHKREWAEAIADAKKPETRTRRIAKMVEDLTKQQAQKAAKAAVIK